MTSRDPSIGLALVPAAITLAALWRLRTRLPAQNLGGVVAVILLLSLPAGRLAASGGRASFTVMATWHLLCLSAFICSRESSRWLCFFKLGQRGFIPLHLASTILLTSVQLELWNHTFGPWKSSLSNLLFTIGAVAIAFLATTPWLIDKRSPQRSSGLFPVLWLLLLACNFLSPLL